MLSGQQPKRQDFDLYDNDDWVDPFQLGDVNDTWSIAGMKLVAHAKVDATDATPVATFSTDAGTLLIVDAAARKWRFNVAAAAVKGELPVVNSDGGNSYVYDVLLMSGDESSRSRVMFGKIKRFQGVTEV